MHTKYTKPGTLVQSASIFINIPMIVLGTADLRISPAANRLSARFLRQSTPPLHVPRPALDLPARVLRAASTSESRPNLALSVILVRFVTHPPNMGSSLSCFRRM